MIITITAVMTIAAYKRKAAGDITTQELQHYETNVGGGGNTASRIYKSSCYFFFIPQKYIPGSVARSHTSFTDSISRS
jgi:hypothetical protein